MAIQKINVSKKSQDMLCAYARGAHRMWLGGSDQRHYMEYVDQDYYRTYRQDEKSIKAEVAMRNATPTLFRNIIYPIVMPAVEAATTYQVSVFCTGSPIFGIVSSPDNAEVAAQLETVIDSQAQKGAWAVEFEKCFRDGFKYNTSAIFCDWDIKYGPTNSTAPGSSDSQTKPIWQGNKVWRGDPYNTFYDPRVAASSVAEDGEFIGEIRRLSGVALKSLILGLPSKITGNITAAMDSRQTGDYGARFYFPKLGQTLYGKALQSEFNWNTYLGMDAIPGADSKALDKYSVSYELVRLYVRICPSDFGIDCPAKNTPQIWRLLIVNWQVLIHAELVTTEFTMLPGLVCETYEDGMGGYTKSMAENVVPFQQLATAYVNSGIAARRRAINDRAIYNQTLIDQKHIDNDSPNAKIPMKPSAVLNRTPQEAYHAIPFTDTISGSAMQEAEMIASLAQKTTRQNPAKQGQFVKGNKTRSEFDTVMNNSNAADQCTALHFESRIFTPLKNMIKYNTIRYQGPASLFSRQQRKVIKINPADLSAAVIEFKISDGLVPSSKLADTDGLQVMAQTVGQVPQLAQKYDTAAIFSSLFQAMGVDIRDFKYDAATAQYNQQLQAWQQAAAQAAQTKAPFNTPMPQPPQSAGPSGAPGNIGTTPPQGTQVPPTQQQSVPPAGASQP